MLDVLIVGGGPVGLFLGCLLAQRGLNFQVLERRTEISAHSRAVGLHPPSLELFEQIDLAAAAVATGIKVRSGLLRGGAESGLLGELHFASVSERYPFILILPQQRTEQLLEARLAALASDVLRRGVEVQALYQTAEGARVTVQENGEVKQLYTRFVVAADGRRSVVRGLLGVEYAGRNYRDSYLMGDFPDTTAYGSSAALHLSADGIVESFPLPQQLRRWVAYTDQLQSGATAADLTALLHQRTGFSVPAAECQMLSAFETGKHLAGTFVQGRTLLIGDAAHEISPIGGQGLTLGWLDAATLAPLLERQLAKRGDVQYVDAKPFERWSVERRNAAKRAMLQAEINMWMGAPAVPILLEAKKAAARWVLHSSAAPKLAELFTMRWSL